MDFARTKPVIVFVQRRAEMRQRVFLQIGKLLTAQNRVLTECTFHDMSSSGARVKIFSGEAMPRNFRFFDAAGGYTRIARLAWQDGRKTGLSFISGPIALTEEEFQTFGQDWQP